ncbi:hypothetical protein ACFW4O_10565 [Streptomyces mutabilis]|jgi:hypothetical protein|uniref:hypothetical protein n=1 Tax=Streptomyces TaxID=1883 RepID=UPI001B38CC8F|nr:hypothetical protein [Streptomyces sp. RK31]MBQ0972783.1 hypothetical protein [Streptomyces sp. RK31]
MHTGRPLISSVTAGLGGTALALGGAPWWLTAAAVGCLGLSLIVVFIQSVFPQESAHRLAWWRDRRRHQQLRRQGLPATGHHDRARTAEETADRAEEPGRND